MKKSSFLIILSMIFATITFAQPSTSKNESQVQQSSGANFNWKTTETIYLGKITKGKPVTVTFEFVNNGVVPLIIHSAKGQCGCTSVEYTKEAVKPNGKGTVTAVYNAATIGKFNKSITVESNTGEPVLLHLIGEVTE